MLESMENAAPVFLMFVRWTMPGIRAWTPPSASLEEMTYLTA